MFYVDYLISLTHLCFIAFLSLYTGIILIDVMIFSAAQLQGCLINILTHCMALRSHHANSMTTALVAVDATASPFQDRCPGLPLSIQLCTDVSGRQLSACADSARLT